MSKDPALRNGGLDSVCVDAIGGVLNCQSGNFQTLNGSLGGSNSLLERSAFLLLCPRATATLPPQVLRRMPRV